MGVYVLDTNALLRGVTLGFAGEAYTTPSVARELKSRVARTRLEAYVLSRRLHIVRPPKTAVSMVLDQAKEIGEGQVLSTTDVEVAALALALKSKKREPTVLTDDYSLQNLLSKMKISFMRVGLRGIKRRIEYVLVCRACKRIYKSERRTCPICGAVLLRKAVKKEPLS
jgi:UPF0271 protein